MNLGEYKEQVGRIPFGKRLPTALYVHREGLAGVGGSLGTMLDQVVGAVAAANMGIDSLKRHFGCLHDAAKPAARVLEKLRLELLPQVCTVFGETPAKGEQVAPVVERGTQLTLF
ncbi:MAG: hypothetical protein WCT12_17250 [Verrucomicrobiota bacterium]